MGVSGVKKAFQIFKRDVIRLLRNPVALIVTIGVCIIPSLYAWYNIAANWDPYGNTASVKVAIANADEGTTNEYVGELNAGDEAEAELRKNHDLGWVFTDEKDAKEGVERGKYYAAIVIPEDFSADLTSMLTSTFKQSKLAYYVNEKKNAIAPEVTNVGAETIEAQINQTFVGAVSKVVAEKMGQAGTKLDGSLNSAESGLYETVEGAGDSSGEVRKALAGTNGTIDTTKTAIADAQKTLKDLRDQLPALTKALDEGDQLLSTTRGTARDFTTSLSSALSQGNVALGQASARADAAIGTITGDILKAQAGVDTALDTVRDINQNHHDIIAALQDLNSDGILDSGILADILSKLEEQNEHLASIEQDLQTQSDDIKNSASAVSNLSGNVDKAVQNGISVAGDTQATFNTKVLPQLSGGLDSFSAVAGDLSGVVMSLDPSIAQAAGTLDELSSTLDQAKGTVAQVDKNLGGIQDKLATAANDIAALRSSDALSDLENVLNMDADDVQDFMTSPVSLETKDVYPVATYGSGVAPFYTNLAIWVGGFVLIAIFKLEVDPEGVGAFTPAQGYFGRWLLMMVLGQIQAAIVCAGDLVIGVQNVAPGLFILAGLVASFVYVNLIFALAMAFKHIGKAIAVIIVILQIPGASGIYPIEMMPAFFRALYPLLPFTYGINAMRETIGGLYGMHYWQNLGILLLFVLVALFIGLRLRPRMLNLNLLFDRALARTDLMICEEHGLENRRFQLSAIVRAMLGDDHYRAELTARAARFEHRYPHLIRGGFVLVFGLPVVLALLMTALSVDIEGKIVLLVLWIVSVIAADTYMIVIEYVRANLGEQLSRANGGEGRREGEFAGAGVSAAVSVTAAPAVDSAPATASVAAAAPAHLAVASPAATSTSASPVPAQSGVQLGAHADVHPGTHPDVHPDTPLGNHAKKGGE